MGLLYFGRQEQVRCVLDVEIHGGDNEPLCLAYKTTTFHVGGGVYFHDDGYVLKAREWHQDRYYALDAATIETHQSTGALPTPLPAYSIPIGDYVWGYLLWIILAAMFLSAAFRRHRRRKRDRLAARLREGQGTPSGPALHTPADFFVREMVTPLLRSDERVVEQAYVVDRDVDSAGVIGALFARGFFAVLTTERMILISTRLGILGPGLENRGIESIERRSIRSAVLDGDALVLALVDGGTKRLVIRVDDASLSSQQAFARAVSAL